MDLSKLSTGDRVIVASGGVLFIAYFLPWFTADAGFVSVSASGGDVGFLWATLPMLLGLAAAGVIIASKLFDVTLPDLPIPWGQALLGAGALAALLVVLKLLIGEDAGGAEALGIDVSRGFGIFLAALAAIGLAAGGFLKMQETDSAAPGGDGGTSPF